MRGCVRGSWWGTGGAASGAANCSGWDCMYGAVSGGCEGLRAGGTVCGSAGGAVSGAARGWSCVRGFGWGSKQAVMRVGLHRLRHGRASGGTPTKSKCKQDDPPCLMTRKGTLDKLMAVRSMINLCRNLSSPGMPFGASATYKRAGHIIGQPTQWCKSARNLDTLQAREIS